MLLRIWTALAAALLSAACSPVFDWRELQPEGSGVSVLFPCKPDRQARTLKLADHVVKMSMLACSAGGVTFALSFADLPEPAAVGRALEALRGLAVGNVAGTAGQHLPAQVAGMTPNPGAVRLAIAGSLPDGVAVVEQAMFFTKGLRVYQASAIGTRLPAGAADAFMASLRLLP